MTFAGRLEKFGILFLTELKRDTQSMVGFGAKYLWLLFPCFIYGYLFRASLWRQSISLDGRSIDFPVFLISGLMAARIIPLSVRVFDESLAGLRNAGLAEWSLITPTSFWEFFAARSAWNALRALTEILAILGFASLLMNIPAGVFLRIRLILPAFLLFAACAGIGMFLTGITLVLRRGSIAFAFFFQLSAAFGGVFFPVRLLGDHAGTFRLLSDCLPVTYALNAVRLLLVQDTAGSARHELILTGMTFVFLGIGSVVLQKGLIWSKKNGRI